MTEINRTIIPTNDMISRIINESTPFVADFFSLDAWMIFVRKGYGGLFILFRIVGTSWPFGVPRVAMFL